MTKELDKAEEKQADREALKVLGVEVARSLIDILNTYAKGDNKEEDKKPFLERIAYINELFPKTVEESPQEVPQAEEDQPYEEPEMIAPAPNPTQPLPAPSAKNSSKPKKRGGKHRGKNKQVTNK